MTADQQPTLTPARRAVVDALHDARPGTKASELDIAKAAAVSTSTVHKTLMSLLDSRDVYRCRYHPVDKPEHWVYWLSPAGRRRAGEPLHR